MTSNTKTPGDLSYRQSHIDVESQRENNLPQLDLLGLTLEEGVEHEVELPIPNPNNWPRRIPWLMVSKAAERSRRSNRVTLSLLAF